MFCSLFSNFLFLFFGLVLVVCVWLVNDKQHTVLACVFLFLVHFVLCALFFCSLQNLKPKLIGVHKTCQVFCGDMDLINEFSSTVQFDIMIHVLSKIYVVTVDSYMSMMSHSPEAQHIFVYIFISSMADWRGTAALRSAPFHSIPFRLGWWNWENGSEWTPTTIRLKWHVRTYQIRIDILFKTFGQTLWNEPIH